MSKVCVFVVRHLIWWTDSSPFSGHIHTEPDSFFADMKTITARASVQT